MLLNKIINWFRLCIHWLRVTQHRFNRTHIMLSKIRSMNLHWVVLGRRRKQKDSRTTEFLPSISGTVEGYPTSTMRYHVQQLQANDELHSELNNNTVEKGRLTFSQPGTSFPIRSDYIYFKIQKHSFPLYRFAYIKSLSPSSLTLLPTRSFSRSCLELFTKEYKCRGWAHFRCWYGKLVWVFVCVCGRGGSRKCILYTTRNRAQWTALQGEVGQNGNFYSWKYS